MQNLISKQKNIYFPKVNTIEINSDFFRINQGFGREKNENRGEFKGYILVIICCKIFEKFALCRYITQPKTAVIVYSEPIASGYINKIFIMPENTFQV